MAEKMITGEIVSIGTEILLGQIVDTNAAEAGVLFAELGIRHLYRQTVGDHTPRMVETLRLALSRSDVVLCIGGLGPTEDDVTRDAIAAALGDTMISDPSVVAELQEIFRRNGRLWTESQVRQAMRPTCAEAISNPNGTAPGLICRKDGKVVVALPGPRSEFVPLLQGRVREVLAELGGQGTVISRVLRVAGIGEAVIEERIREITHQTNPTVAPYAKPAEVHLRLTAYAPTSQDANGMLDPVEAAVRAELGFAVYGVDDETLEHAVIQALKRVGKTLAVAESCTGGGLGARLTSVPGSSSAFWGGVIAYDNSLKQHVLAVPESILVEHGAVSEECARALAEGVRKLAMTDYALSITGIAGPEGGTTEKPVGLVYMALASPDDTQVTKAQYRGSREDIRVRASTHALNMMRLKLLSE